MASDVGDGVGMVGIYSCRLGTMDEGDAAARDGDLELFWTD